VAVSQILSIVLGLQNELIMTIEDDGDGFDIKNKKVGVGKKTCAGEQNRPVVGSI
jgi:glucose-6-phosphate-specific signal transduction histidine kinase